MAATDAQIEQAHRGKIRHAVGWLRIWMHTYGVPPERIDKLTPQVVDEATNVLLRALEVPVGGPPDHVWDRRGYVRGKKARAAG